MTLAKTLMVQGTASSVGKSLLVTALCRIFRRAGISVAPFKAQNMALNAAVTPDGLEIGRAQAVQAEAAGLLPRVEMNPVLLKPEGDSTSQIILMGRPVGRLSAAQYYADDRAPLREAIAESLATLRREHDLVIIEGAGSPAELNLQHRDLVNMHVARLADAPVLLVGDIDRGGIFASLLGTLMLLPEQDRARVAGLVVNKFRGDRSLFDSGVQMLQERTGKPVLGVIPMLHDLGIADEDSVSIDARMHRARPAADVLDVVVIRLPRISNHDDVLPLEREPGVCVRFTTAAEDVLHADLVILPGSKSTVSDLLWLRERGLADALHARADRALPILGLCGGCQMLGTHIEDPHGIESSAPSTAGLGLLPLRTRFERDKTTAQARATLRAAAPPSFLTRALPAQHAFDGYEIHHGAIALDDDAHALLEVQRKDGSRALDGAASENGAVVGSLLHGTLRDATLRAALLTTLRARRNLAMPRQAGSTLEIRDDYEHLADAVETAIDMSLLRRMVGLT